MAGRSNSSIPTPAKSLGGRFGAGDPFVASPETQPLETAQRDFRRTAVFKVEYDESRRESNDNPFGPTKTEPN